MATGATLTSLLNQLRVEIGASANPAQSVNSIPYWTQILQRTQRRLYAKRKWGHLWVYREKSILAGERYYTFPVELEYEQITQAWVKYSTQWEPLGYGIGPCEYNVTDSDLDSRSVPIVKWDHYEGNQFEVWPTPSDGTQTVRFYGYKKLADLVSVSDRADLDEDLIVLFAAAEILERAKSPDAKSKAVLANDHYQSLMKNDTKADIFILGGKAPSANSDARVLGDYDLRVNRI